MTIHFKTLSALKAAAKNAHFIDFAHAKDEFGYYFTSHTVDPRAVAIFEAREAAVRAKLANAPIVVAEPKVKPVTPRRGEGGPCAEIRAWTISNTTATKDDAIAQFPQFNRATVAIQFKKARS